MFPPMSLDEIVPDGGGRLKTEEAQEMPVLQGFPGTHPDDAGRPWNA